MTMSHDILCCSRGTGSSQAGYMARSAKVLLHCHDIDIRISLYLTRSD